MSIKHTIKNKNYYYIQYNNGYYEEFKYDNDGYVIYHRNSNSDQEYTYEYDDNGNLISRYINGELCDIYKYDEDNNKIYECFISENNSFEAWYEYDERGNLIHELNTNGYESWREYDNQDHEIYCYDTNSDNSIIQ